MARRDRYDRHVEDRFVKGAFSTLGYVTRYKNQVLVAALIVLAAVIGWLAYNSHLKTYNSAALEEFEKAKTAEEYKRVGENYPGSRVEPIAIFYHGRKLVEDKKFDEAENIFESIVDEFPSHYVTPEALAFSGMLSEQKDEFAKAVEKYKELLDRYPESFPVPRVMLSLGGCYEKLGQGREARMTYEELIGSYPSSGYKNTAEERMASLSIPETSSQEEKRLPEAASVSPEMQGKPETENSAEGAESSTVLE